MNFDCTCEKYGISPCLLEQLCEKDFAGEKTAEGYVFSDEDVCVISEALFLHSAGLSDECILSFFDSDNCGKERILRCVRRHLLDDIHTRQQMLDKIDHVIYKLQNEKCCDGRSKK